jgi:hypothetical protein
MTDLGTQQINYCVGKGDIAELQFDLFATKQKWQLARPLFTNAPYDRIIFGRDNGPLWETVQIKRAYNYKGKMRVDLRKNGGRRKIQYNPFDFDLLFVLNGDTNEWYCIPYDEVKHIKCEISISDTKWQQFKI